MHYGSMKCYNCFTKTNKNQTRVKDEVLSNVENEIIYSEDYQAIQYIVINGVTITMLYCRYDYRSATVYLLDSDIITTIVWMRWDTSTI